ncbi:hypothetical protein FF38_01841, partial [Lucilia cuprina]
GYVTSQAFIPEQDLTKQKLIITVIEGKIRSIDIENSPPRLAKMIFPNYVGAILNLRDIEQGLEQLNRSSSAKYTIDIQPSHKNGYSRIFVYKKSAKVPLSGQLNIDNSGKDVRVFADTMSNTGKDTLIQAQNNLWVQKNASGDLATLIENKSGTIKTNAGDL